MTKREFDALTRENWGERGMASDERATYRNRRLKMRGDDFIARRAYDMFRRNGCRMTVLLDGFLPTLGIGSSWRNVAAARAHHGVALLEGRRCYSIVRGVENARVHEAAGHLLALLPGVAA